MEESLRLTQQQKLQQRLTPLQVQFVRMLEMTGPEVEDEVERALDDNPALEAVDETVTATSQDEEFTESAEQMQLADYRDPDDIPYYRLEARNHSADDRLYTPEATAASGESLIDSLNEQIAQSSLEESLLTMAEYIIGNLDDNGYLTRSVDAIANDVAIAEGLEVTPEQARQAWNAVRQLEPAGIGATDLRDSLLLQLRRREPSERRDHAIAIIDHYFDLFSKKHFDRITSLLGITRDELQDAMALIRQLNPKPGSGLAHGEGSARPIVPDFAVDVDGDDITLTLLNNLPELQISATFAEEFIDPGRGRPWLPDWASARQPNPGTAAALSGHRDAYLFIKQKRDEARDFIKILSMRQQTLFAVMSAIVKIQRDFFLSDEPSQIKPMILKDIAAITGFDLSVISRAAAGKYVVTRGGVYPLKMFFNERPKEDDDTSSMQIIDLIKKIIGAEDKSHPLSDEAITQQLQDQGLDIARRTVAKYRERIGLPVARLRKEI